MTKCILIEIFNFTLIDKNMLILVKMTRSSLGVILNTLLITNKLIKKNSIVYKNSNY